MPNIQEWTHKVPSVKGMKKCAFYSTRRKKRPHNAININGVDENIPNFYIFKRLRRKINHISKCEHEATMSKQKNTWMTTYLFNI